MRVLYKHYILKENVGAHSISGGIPGVCTDASLPGLCVMEMMSIGRTVPPASYI
jgi:hypothetical protein